MWMVCLAWQRWSRPHWRLGGKIKLILLIIFSHGSFFSQEHDKEFTLNGFYRCRFDKIRMRVVGKDQVYTTEEEVLAGTGDIVRVSNTGMYCMHSLGDQPDGKCFEYEIQLCCM